ncbi:MAG: insulinase family protein [Bacteroidales bacterium]|nr:insulinase family protein [Bacteroidales bacterium]
MRNKIYTLVLGIFIIIGCACSPQGDFEKDGVYHGFKLVKKKFVKEVNANCLYFIHEKSGARLLKIDAEDANKLFSMSFKTTPDKDYGTPHIIEHSVLNGSESFPVKSPFDILTKGSLNTFLNAMTGPDFTTYPVASMNEKDYFNLMHVYLDAVLKPLLHVDDRIFKQEGWHYELDNIDGDIVYKGVVYNEMKGSFSNPERELWYQTYKILFPDNTYGVSSGGYPLSIPKLTIEHFRNFHKKYYHPSNGFILLYGDADLNKELEFIDTNYLASFENNNKKIEIPLQKPFTERKVAEKTYPIREGASTKDKTHLTYNFVFGKDFSMENQISLGILSWALVGHEAAPLRLALQEAKIAKDFYAYNDSKKQNVFIIGAKKSNPEHKEKFEEIIFNTLEKVSKEGFDKDMIDGIINRIEFNLREGNTSNKGMMYLFRTVHSVFFTEDPFLGLEFEEPLAKVKEGLKNGLLEKIIKENLLENKFALLMSLKPEPGLEKKITAKVKKELADYKASLSKEELQKLVDETKALKEYQKQEDKPEDVAKVPMLLLSDIEPKAKWYQVEERKVENTPVLFYNDFTNDILYSNIYFDLRVLPKESIPYANLLCELIGDLSTEKYSFGDLSNQFNIHTGSFYTDITTFTENNSDDKLIPKLSIFYKSTNLKGAKAFELISEVLQKTKYDDPERLKTLLSAHYARVESNIKNYGSSVATGRLSSYYNNTGMFSELTKGIEYYHFISDLYNNFDEQQQEISENLAKVASILFNKNNIVAAVTCSDKNYKDYETGLQSLIASLPEGSNTLNDWKFDFDLKNEGLMSTSKVQYVLKGYNFKKLGYEWNGKMRVLNQILSRDYLQKQIRVIGGAYGGYTSFSNTGNIYFASYRDPNLKETVTNFDATPEFLKNFEADKQTMDRFIIGTVSRLERPTTASERGNIATRNYFNKTTKELVQAERDAVLSTTVEDIKSFEKMIKDILEQNAICVYGNNQKIKENKSLFKTTYNVTK